MTEDFFGEPPRLVYAGGTIGCTGSPRAPLPGPAFRAACLSAGFLAGAAWEWTPTPLDSTAMGPADWLDLAARVLASPGPAVILQGTDTMAWTAAALAVLLTDIGADGMARAAHAAPVVLTGSQRPLLRADGAGPEPGSDAHANLRAALAAAQAAHPGPVIVFGGRILEGIRAEKVGTEADAAFAMPNGPGRRSPLPAADPAALRAHLNRLRPHFGRRAVLAVHPVPGDPALAARALAGAIDALGPDLGALHLLGLGAGNMPGEAELGPILARAAANGVLIAAGTQVARGPANPDLYASGHWLAACGAIGTGDRTRAAVQVRLHLALALAAVHGWDRAQSMRFLAAPLAGDSG